MSRPLPTLKAFYYLDHFMEMIGFVEQRCGAVIGEEERRYLEDFRGLSTSTRGLKVRIANRRGRVFRVSRLRYAEIPDMAGALAELVAAKFVREPEAGDLPLLLEALTRPELVALLRACGGRASGSMTKSGLIAEALGCCDFDCLGRLGLAGGFIVQERGEVLDFLLFLYFGRRQGSLQTFALRDLGILGSRDSGRGFEPRFRDPLVARHAFFHEGLRARIKSAGEDEAVALAAEIDGWPREGCEAEFHRAVSRLGARLERAGRIDEALGVYGYSDVHPARERLCRLRFAAGETEAVKRLLEEVIAAPSSDEELLFAEDFRARKFGERKVGRLTRLLREAPVIRIDEAFRDGAEQAAAGHFSATGIRAVRAENHFWSALFGVLLWDELHGEGVGMTPNEFDPRPTQWLDGSFAVRRQAAIETRLATLGTAAAARRVREVFAGHFGEPNGIFRWRRSDEGVLVEFLERAPAPAVEWILRRMIADPRTNTRGYPDLLLFTENGVRFVEIKAEGDQIRRHQLVQIEALREAGFEVEVVRVEWCVDPDQEYVVVDIETTGGRAEHHRVTEIGAVKMRRGEVIGRFQTLIDPERRIPAMITRLTGITDAMVAGAPKFAGIAAEFREFVGDAVFVAHSAAFDYGFLRAEFARLGENFRRPTLCTVVAMRKHYPGLASYKLARLCDEFSIPLANHHRALCDAEATAGLLRLVNLKRLDGLPSQAAAPASS